MYKQDGKILTLSSTIILVLFLSFSFHSFSQKQTTIDSLLNLLDIKKDSGKVVVLRQLSWEYRNLDTSKAISFGNQALAIAVNLNLNHEQADILGRLGVYKRNAGNFSKAMDYYFKSLELAQKGNYLKLQAIEYNNIGDIYNRLGIYNQALENVNKALNISTLLKDKYTLSYIHHMLGLIFKNNSMVDSALAHFRISLKYRNQLKLMTGIGSSYLNIGMIYYLKANYDSSFIYYNRALDIFNLMNDKVGIANTYKCIGDYYNQKKDYEKALLSFNNSMKLIKGFGIPDVNKDAAEGLKYSFVKLREFEKALFYQELATRIKDSLANNLFVQKITQLSENFKYEIKSQEQEIIRKQKEEILNQRINYQRNQLNIFILVFALMVILVGIIIFFYRAKNVAYRALNQKNTEIAELNEGLIFANGEINLQKEKIESQRNVLQEQHDKLELLNSTKDKLFSIIAHDLRGPFNSIIGFSELLKENIHTSKVEELEEMIVQINQVGINTYKILDNLLNWAKTQINQVNIKLENINISVIINDLVNDLDPLANSKKVKLSYQTPVDFDVKVDLNMVNTVLRNLVSNSIKYSNTGGIINISAKRTTDHAEITIQDNGIGMSDDIKNNLFASNVNPSTLGTNNEKGTGLGLVICNEFIKKLNGKIWVESELGKGSVFRFTLPLGSL